MDELSKELTIEMLPSTLYKEIAEAIGVENFVKLADVVGGSTVYIPKPESVTRPVRDARIKEEFNGYNHRSSPEQVRRHRAMGSAALRRGEAGGTDEPSSTTAIEPKPLTSKDNISKK